MEVRERSLQSETRLKHAGREGGAGPAGIAARDVWHGVSDGRRRWAALWAPWLVLLLSAWAGPAAAERVVVLAAASTAHVIDAVIERFEAGPDDRVVASYAGTSALARQIESGAPADIFVAANAAWMDHVEALGLIEAESRQVLAGNRLVFVTGGSGMAPFEPSASLDLGALLDGERLAIGNPDHVPAGIYARQALEALGPLAKRERQPRAGGRRAGGARAGGARRGAARHRLRDRRHPRSGRPRGRRRSAGAARADRLPGRPHRGPQRRRSRRASSNS